MNPTKSILHPVVIQFREERTVVIFSTREEYQKLCDAFVSDENAGHIIPCRHHEEDVYERMMAIRFADVLYIG